MLEEINRAGLDLIAAPQLERTAGVAVLFSSRRGGVSEGTYSSLNLSFKVGDKRTCVLENRERLANWLGVDPDRWVLCQQVHGARVTSVGSLERGRGGVDYLSAVPRSDGLVTVERQTPLGIQTADCMPLILVIPSGPAIGIAHVGWRGSLAGVASRVLQRLSTMADEPPTTVQAFIGPHIRECCLELGADIVKKFKERFGDSVAPGEGTEAPSTVSLAAACRVELERHGVMGEAIVEADACTCCGEGYFSYRRSGGVTGRQVGMVAILNH